MALDTAAKRAAAAHVKRLAKGVTPDATTPQVWRMAVGWNYGGNSLTPVGSAAFQDHLILGTKESFSVTSTPTLGGQWSW